MKILNLTQHPATTEQVAAGVVDFVMDGEDFASGLGLRQDQFGYFISLSDVLTFDKVPTQGQMDARAILLARAVKSVGCAHAMIGGAPFFMATLEKALAQNGIQPVYAFSQRESVETIKEDGSVVKSAVFRHVGFVEADVILGMPESQED